jgi:ABC-type glutathione transport system ATPase component
MQLVNAVADRIVVLHHGELLAEGGPTTVLRTLKASAEIYLLPITTAKELASPSAQWGQTCQFKRLPERRRKLRSCRNRTSGN